MSMSEYEVATRMQRHDLHKLHGLGNDFLLWFRPEVPDDAPDIAQRWCDRRTGIGADGLIVAVDRRHEAHFTLFNADGGRAEVSGNGLRCFGHAIARNRGLDELELVVQTDAGERRVTVRDALSADAEADVVMGSVAPGPAADHLEMPDGIAALSVNTIDIGNPHVVIEVDDPHAHDMAVIGPLIEAQFQPTGINVHLVAPTPSGLTMNIWERGAGVTEACGSGACAAAAVMTQAGRAGSDDAAGSRVHVEMPGGSARVVVADELTLIGPSTYIAAVSPLGES